MYGAAKKPKDRTRYAISPDSWPLTFGEPVGRYVFVVDLTETIHVAPDGSHMHPKVLGLAQAALQAGEISIDRLGGIEEVTNCSGTFQFDSQQSLCVATRLGRIGFAVDNVMWYPPDGLTPPRRLQCP